MIYNNQHYTSDILSTDWHRRNITHAGVWFPTWRLKS